MPCVFDDGDLHTEANSEIWNFVFTRVFARRYHALDTARSKASGDNNAVHVFECLGNILVRYRLAVNPFEVYADEVCSARVFDCFHERNVRVAQGNVFTHDCDFHLVGSDLHCGDFFLPFREVTFIIET